MQSDINLIGFELSLSNDTKSVEPELTDTPPVKSAPHTPFLKYFCEIPCFDE